MKDNLLIITVGLPQSGKSTWARKLAAPIVNPDAIRLAIHGQPFIASAEPIIWAMARYMVVSLFLAGHNKIILDATNTTRKRRDAWRGNWGRGFVVFGGPEMKQECIDRSVLTTTSVDQQYALQQAIERMAEKWEPITPDELDEDDNIINANSIRR